MSISTLYTTSCFEYHPDTGLVISTIELNPAHPVFSGHFPGNPVLPGICTLQIAKELLSRALGGNYRISKASTIKYLGFVNPVLTPEMTFQHTLKHVENGAVQSSVTVTASGNTVCTFKAEYIAES